MFKQIIQGFEAHVRMGDLLDVAIVAFIVYRLLLLIRGTRAMQMLTGLGILGLGYFFSNTLELFTTHWMLASFFDYWFFIVLVVFQDDLRRALTTVGKNPFFASAELEEERAMVDEITRAAVQLAREHSGALIVIERETGLKNFIETGSQLEAKITSELIYSLFDPSSPLHDGAIIVSRGRIAAAGCFLPLSKDSNIDKRYGTRHRAALGITEDTDAVVVLVSEEAGEVHLVKNGKITMNLSENELRMSLEAVLDLTRIPFNVPRRLRGWLQLVRQPKD